MVTYGDKITRILYPSFIIDAVNGEEAYCLCGACGVKANHPCAGCLAHRDELNLHLLSKSFELQTQESMTAVCTKSSKLPTTAHQNLLCDYGLHFIEVQVSY